MRKIYGSDEHLKSLFHVVSYSARVCFDKLFFKCKHEHDFSQVSNQSQYCSGLFLFGKCLSEVTEENSDSNVRDFLFSCPLCEFHTSLCKACKNEFENNKYFMISHQHPFRKFHVANSWVCDNCSYESNHILEAKLRFKCYVCPDFDFCGDCMQV